MMQDLLCFLFFNLAGGPSERHKSFLFPFHRDSCKVDQIKDWCEIQIVASWISFGGSYGIGVSTIVFRPTT